MAIKTFITRNPLTADEATYAVGTMNTEASIWLNNLSTLTAEVDYSLNDIKTQTVQLNDWLTVVDEYNRKYEFTVEEIRYVANALEITATELGVIATQNQLNELNYVNQQAVDILAGERDGPIKSSPLATYQIELTSSSTSDVDRKATIAGFNNAGQYTSEILPLKGTTTVTSSTTWSEIHYITMSSATAGIITMTDGTNTLAKLGVGDRRVANTDAVGTYGNGVCYKIYNLPTPTMAVKVATKFDNFNGASQQSGFTYTGSSANSTSWASQGTHSVNIPASSTISKSIDFGTTNEIWQIEFDVYLNTLGTLTVTAGATTLATINSGAGEWQTIKLDTSAITGTQTLTFTTAAGTDVYIDSIRYMDNKYVVPYADDPIGAIQFNGENALQGIAKVCNFSVVSATNQSYDFKIKDNEDQEAWNVTKTLQLYFKPQVGSATSVLSLSSSDALNNLSYNLSAYDIINRVTVYGGGDGAYRKFATAEDTTSQSLYGVRTPQNPPSYTDVTDLTVLQSIADAIIEKYKDPVVNFETELLLQNLNADIGDTITIDDTQLGIHFEKIITRINYKYANNSEGYISLELADVTDDLTVDAATLNRDRNNLNTANKGAVNLYMTGETQNIDSANPMDIEFYIPQDVTEINKIDLNYSVEDYRTFQGAIPADSPVTSTVNFVRTVYNNFSTTSPIGAVQYNFGNVDTASYSAFETNPSEIVFSFGATNYGTTSATFSATNPIRMKVYNSDIGGSKTVGAGDGEINFPVVQSTLSSYGLNVAVTTVRIFPTGDEYFFNGTGLYGFSVVVPFVTAVWSNGNSSGLSFYGNWSFKNFHDHDTFPIIQNITKDLDGLNIEISENGGAYTNVTSDLTALYGTLHTSSVGASSKTTYDLSSVYTFNPDNWYTVRMTPTNNETLWFGYETLTDTQVGTTSTNTYSLRNNVWENGTEALDPTVKTQGTYSLSWTQQAATSGFGILKTINLDQDFTNKRYILFDLYLPDTPANLDLKNLMFMVTSDDSSNNLTPDIPTGGGARAMAAWELDISQLSSGWNTDIRMDFNNQDNSAEVSKLLGTTSLVKSQLNGIKGIMLRGAFGTGLAADATWRIDNLRYKSGGLARLRGDIFTSFYLETGGAV